MEIKVIICEHCSYLITRNDKPFIVLNSKKQSENFLVKMKFNDNKNTYKSEKLALFHDAEKASKEINGD